MTNGEFKALKALKARKFYHQTIGVIILVILHAGLQDVRV
jgi:hypothetical protein